MKSWTWVVAAGLASVAAVAFLIGRSNPRRPPVRTPETGGPAPAASVQATATTAKAGPAAGDASENAAPQSEQPPPISPRPAPAPPTSVAGGTYASRELKVSVETPKSGGWVMNDNPRQFRAPLPVPSKRLEIRRDPTASDPRLAMIELHVLDLAAGSSEAEEILKVERPGKSSKFGTYKVVEEGTIEIGGRTFQSRITYWDARNTPLAKQDPRIAETKILSVRTVQDGKLYALIAFSPADQFDSFRPEIDQAMQSLRLR